MTSRSSATVRQRVERAFRRRLLPSLLAALALLAGPSLPAALPAPGGPRGDSGAASGLLPAAFAQATGQASLVFDGAGGQVVVADAPGLRVTGPLTVEAWLKPQAAAGHRHAVGKNDWELSVEPQGQGVRFVFEFATTGPGAGWAGVASGELPAGRWYHVAGVYDGAAMRLFVDGQPVASRARSGPIAQTANPLRIGSADGWGDLYVGAVDDVRLSAAARYAGPFARPAGPLAADGATRGLWRLDEGAGTAAADASGNGRTGTLTGAPAPRWSTDTPW
jgi:hypothetical protein